MRTLILGSSGKIGKHFIKSKSKHVYTYNKNKIKHGVKFNIKRDNIKKLIKKFSIKKVVILSAISDPDYCYINKKKSYMLNVLSTKKIIDKLIDQKIYFHRRVAPCIETGLGVDLNDYYFFVLGGKE